MLYPASCPRCSGAVELSHDIPVGQGEIVHDADILQCLSCGWERLSVANVAPATEPPAESPTYWRNVGNPRGGGKPRGRWNRYHLLKEG